MMTPQHRVGELNEKAGYCVGCCRSNGAGQRLMPGFWLLCPPQPQGVTERQKGCQLFTNSMDLVWDNSYWQHGTPSAGVAWGLRKSRASRTLVLVLGITEGLPRWSQKFGHQIPQRAELRRFPPSGTVCRRSI